MKNIHILPTDKPSRLFDDGIELYLGEIKDRKGHPVTSYNIYITSDEEIKERDWFYLDMSHSNTLPDEIHQMGNDKWSKTGGIHFCEGNTWVDSCKKIILTTDPDLIKDGVQAIDDDFLEWFVKNPSCEEVEVKKFNGFAEDYLIIIPKEEPKQKILENHYLSTPNSLVDIFRMNLDNHPNLHKQETLEEAAKRLYPTTINSFTDSSFDMSETERLIFINGAKWQSKQTAITLDDAYSEGFENGKNYQAERMYSDEELKKVLTEVILINPSHLSLLRNGYGEFPDSYKLTENGVNYIIEQFKNK